MSPIRLSIRNPVLSNLLMITLTVLGVIAFIDLPREMMPKISFNWAFIITPYPNVPPEDIEQLVTVPIEEEIADLDGIDQMTSVSSEGSSFIWVKYEMVSDDKFARYLTELKSEVDKAEIPDDAEDPIVEDFDTDDFVPIISISLSGDYPERTMYDIAEDLKDRFLDIKGVSSIAVAGTRKREIWVEVAPEKLYAMGISLEQIANALTYRNFNLAAGDMKTGREKLLVRSVGEFEDIAEIGNSVVVHSGPNGRQVFLRDIATITDGWEEEQSRARLDGFPAITLSISKKAKANSLDIIESIKQITEEYNDKLPPGMVVTYTNDNSIYILDILRKLQTNAWMGLVLVLVVLWIVLGWRNALITAIGIPIALSFTFLILDYTGNTLNGNSLFGLVLVLGMLVDDAIVVMENCYRHIQRGLPPREAALIGAKEVAAPVLSSVFTTIAAFLPLMLMPGIIGKFMRIVPFVVSMALIASLIECFLILPSHVAEWARRSQINHGGNPVFLDKILRIYRIVLEWILRRRKWVMVIMPVIILLSALLIPLLGVEMYRDEEISQFFVRVKMPAGTSLDVTDQVVTQIEQEAMLLPASELHAAVATPGLYQGDDEWLFTSSVGQVIVDLKERRDRTLPLDSLINLLRYRTEDIPGIEAIEFAKVNTGPPLGKPIEVRVQGKYFATLEAVAEDLKAELSTIDGVFDIA
ncbi:MAG: efflux RND transporter permease subunit, partial [bacterium]